MSGESDSKVGEFRVSTKTSLAWQLLHKIIANDSGQPSKTRQARTDGKARHQNMHHSATSAWEGICSHYRDSEDGHFQSHHTSFRLSVAVWQLPFCINSDDNTGLYEPVLF